MRDRAAQLLPGSSISQSREAVSRLWCIEDHCACSAACLCDESIAGADGGSQLVHAANASQQNLMPLQDHRSALLWSAKCLCLVSLLRSPQGNAHAYIYLEHEAPHLLDSHRWKTIW